MEDNRNNSASNPGGNNNNSNNNGKPNERKPRSFLVPILISLAMVLVFMLLSDAVSSSKYTQVT